MTPAEKAVIEAAAKRPWVVRDDPLRWCGWCDVEGCAVDGEPTPHSKDCEYATLDAALDALESEREKE